jgi:thiol-disulfide isomerase/thioredoxin
MRRALVAAFLALLAPAAGAVEAGAAAPSLTLPALGPGSPLSIEAQRGKVVYVDFWASWCVPCRLSMPALDALQKKHGPRGFVVIGVNKDVSAADAERFLKRMPVGFSLAADPADAAARAFDVKAMPSGYLIDRRGVVRRVHRGFTEETARSLEQDVQALLAEPAA